MLHSKIIVAAFTMYALPRAHIDLKAPQREGALYSGSSIMKNDFLALYPAILLTRSAPKNMRTMPVKYITALTQPELSKNAPAKSEITGIFAPQGINGVSIAVALRSRSLRIVRLAITPGTAQPIPITKGMTDLPERPTFLNIGSRTTATLDI